MIKINLLPAFVRERKVVRKLLMFILILLGLELLGFAYWYNRVSTQGYDIGQQLDVAKAQAQEVQRLQSEADSIRAEIEPIKAKTKFIEDTKNFPVKLADLLDSIRRYTYGKVIYTSLQLGGGAGGMMGPMMGGMPGPMMGTGMPGMGAMGGGGTQQITTVSIQGYTDSVENVARYLQNLLRCPQIADVQISGIPGYGTSAGATPGMGGMPGMMGKAPMMGSGMPGMMGGMPGMMPGAGMGTTQTPGQVSISVICYLMEPLTPPSPPTAAPPTAAGMPGMGMPGMGMPGMGMPGAVGPLPQAAAPTTGAPPEGRGRLPGLEERRRMEQEVMEGL